MRKLIRILPGTYGHQMSIIRNLQTNLECFGFVFLNKIGIALKYFRQRFRPSGGAGGWGGKCPRKFCLAPPPPHFPWNQEKNGQLSVKSWKKGHFPVQSGKNRRFLRVFPPWSGQNQGLFDGLAPRIMTWPPHMPPSHPHPQKNAEAVCFFNFVCLLKIAKVKLTKQSLDIR